MAISKCDVIKRNESLCRALSNFSFVIHLWKLSESYVLLKSSSESDLLRFQRYKQFCLAENNKIQKEFYTIIGCISKSIFPTNNSFRLITSHMQMLSLAKPTMHKHLSLLIQLHRPIGKRHEIAPSVSSENIRYMRNFEISIVSFIIGKFGLFSDGPVQPYCSMPKIREKVLIECYSYIVCSL